MKKQITKLLTVLLVIFMSASFTTIFANAATIEESNEAVNKGVEYTINNLPTPAYGSEWQILALSRSNKTVPNGYYDTYYNSVQLKVAEEMVKAEPFTYVTEVEKIILTLNAIGKDPTNVGGYNLVDYIWSKVNIEAQGINALVYGLLALDSKNYDEPTGAVNTRNSLINKILALKTSDGGFSYGVGPAEQDMTGMVLQALAKYKDRADVETVINGALALISSQQRADGGFDNDWGDNPYGAAQMALALLALELDPTDPANGFVKSSGDIISYLFSLQTADGGFGVGGVTDTFLTPQAFYTMVAYNRYLNGKSFLFDMTDVLNETDYNKIVAEINSGIVDISNLDKITLDNKDKIKGLMLKYNSLTDSYKAQVIDFSKLEEANNKIIELEKIINDINNDIWNKINPSKITINDKEAVLDLIKRYEALSDEDKKYVVGYEDVLQAKEIIDSLETNNLSSSEIKTSDNSNVMLYGILIIIATGSIYILRKKVA